MFDKNVHHINEILKKGKGGVIVLPSRPSFDAVSSAISLYLFLTKKGIQQISLVCSDLVKEELIAADKITSSFSTAGNTLVISLPYTNAAIDKVDYKIEHNFFNLLITPKSAQERLDPKNIQYSYVGGTIDYIITIDAPTLAQLGRLYTENQTQFQNATIINIDHHLTNTFFGAINIVEKTASSCSELVLKILESLGGEIDKDIATNLYSGILAATNHFTSYSVTANTFESAAKLLKYGAVKKPQNKTKTQSTMHMKTEKDTTKPLESVEKETLLPEGNETAPDDWLKPKIFRSGDLL